MRAWERVRACLRAQTASMVHYVPTAGKLGSISSIPPSLSLSCILSAIVVSFASPREPFEFVIIPRFCQRFFRILLVRCDRDAPHRPKEGRYTSDYLRNGLYFNYSQGHRWLHTRFMTKVNCIKKGKWFTPSCVTKKNKHFDR